MDLVISMQYFPQGIILPKPITVKNYHANNVIDVLNVWNINILFGKMYLVCWENFTRINLISILSGLFVQKFWHETSIIYGSIYRCKNLVLIQFIPRKVIRILGQYDIFIRLIPIFISLKYKKPGAETKEMHIHVQPIL